MSRKKKKKVARCHLREAVLMRSDCRMKPFFTRMRHAKPSNKFSYTKCI